MIRRGLFLGTAGAALGLFLAQQGGGQEDDMVSTFTISGPVTQAEGNSGTTNFTYTITRSGALSAAGQVSWAVTGTGANPASAADFVGGAFPSGTATFAAGAATANVVVQVQGDTSVETDEQFLVTLSNPRNTAILGSPATALGTITNDDGAVPDFTLAWTGSPTGWGVTTLADIVISNAPPGAYVVLVGEPAGLAVVNG